MNTLFCSSSFVSWKQTQRSWRVTTSLKQSFLKLSVWIKFRINGSSLFALKMSIIFSPTDPPNFLTVSISTISSIMEFAKLKLGYFSFISSSSQRSSPIHLSISLSKISLNSFLKWSRIFSSSIKTCGAHSCSK